MERDEKGTIRAFMKHKELLSSFICCARNQKLLPYSNKSKAKQFERLTDFLFVLSLTEQHSHSTNHSLANWSYSYRSCNLPEQKLLTVTTMGTPECYGPVPEASVRTTVSKNPRGIMSGFPYHCEFYVQVFYQILPENASENKNGSEYQCLQLEEGERKNFKILQSILFLTRLTLEENIFPKPNLELYRSLTF